MNLILALPKLVIGVILILLLYKNFGFSFLFFDLLPLAIFSENIVGRDLKNLIVKNSTLLIITAFQTLIYLSESIIKLDFQYLLRPLRIGIIISLLIIIIYPIFAKYIGGGDLKLIAIFFYVLGGKELQTTFRILMLSAILAGIVSLFLIVKSNLKRHDRVPFSPFMIASFWIVIFSNC